MQAFSYTVLEPSGRKQSGVVEASTREAAISQLTKDGRFALEVKEIGSTAAAGSHQARGRVSREDLALFTRRISDLAGAGLPLDRVLQVVGEQSESPVLTQICEEVLHEVRGGRPVSDALAMHPKYFNQVYTQTLRAGETSGQFPEVAGRLAEFQEKEVTRRSQIVSALVYPMVLATLAIGVIIFMLTFVVPRLKKVFDDLGGELPTATKMLLAMSGFIEQYWILIVAGIGGLWLLYRGWIATDSGKYQRDSFLMNMPLGGVVVRKSTVSRFARVLGTMVFGGVPILESLQLAGLSSGNRVFESSAEQVCQAVREGKPIAEAMRDTGGFPPVLTHMVAIGEETGDLPKMLSRVSESLDFEVDNSLRRLVSLLEPAIVLVMGGFVLFVVLSVLLPIYQAQEIVK
ncbi:MAG: type II secretion system F family protein [Armatimonadetes bacterium]|nr:type II secretion system F family protein [Armatimonadota bacterium]